MNMYLSDTTVVVDFFRGNENATKFLKQFPEISIVSVAEVIQGAHDARELGVITRACDVLHQERIDSEITILAVNLLKKYNLSHGLLFLDALIAATCILRKNILVTQNLKDFKFITGLQVLPQKEAFAKL
jgi:hypothetical protein